MTPYNDDPDCKDKAGKYPGDGSTDVYVTLDENGTSILITRTQGCAPIPLKSGGSLSLSLYTSAGQGSGVSAIPALVSVNPLATYEDGNVKTYSIPLGSQGGTTYWAADAPRPVTMRVQLGGPYFVTEIEADRCV